MNKSKVKSILAIKFKGWLNSIKDEKVKDLAAKNSIITGGCIVSLLKSEKVNDYDIYFTNKETALAVANYYAKEYTGTSKTNAFVLDGDDPKVVENYAKRKELKHINGAYANMVPGRIKIVLGDIHSAHTIHESADENDDKYEEVDLSKEEEEIAGTEAVPEVTKPEENKYKIKFISGNAITLGNKIQIIIRFYGAPEDIHRNFDFVHCTCSWTSANRMLFTPSNALLSILTKELRYIGSLYPVSTLFRLRKYVAAGWSVTAGEILKIAFQISELNLSNIEVLEDQLIGVDVLLFQRMLADLRGKAEVEGYSITYKELALMIDKAFSGNL